jgi:hypothetical protein
MPRRIIMLRQLIHLWLDVYNIMAFILRRQIQATANDCDKAGASQANRCEKDLTAFAMSLATVIRHHFSLVKNRLLEIIGSVGAIVLSAYGSQRGQSEQQTTETIK